jgi:integrase
MARKKLRPWVGGYVSAGKRGPVFVIERRIAGVYFHVSTRCRTERGAMKALERFEANPEGYRPEGEPEREPLLLTPELVADYRAWMLDTKHNTEAWVNDVTRYLGDWADDLGEDDIRDTSIAQLKAMLDARKTSRRHRIEAVKAFCSWLRKERGLLRHAEDPTLDLPVPPSVAERLRRRKVVEPARVLAVLPWLPDASRDVLSLLSGTGGHISEVRRFAAEGELVRPASGEPLAVLVVRHKSGELTRTPIQHREHLEAAERIRARGHIPSNWTLNEHLRRACAAAGVPVFPMGVMRHTVATLAVEQGATPAQVSEFLGHRSQATSKKFYIDVATPTVSIPVLRLVKG